MRWAGTTELLLRRSGLSGLLVAAGGIGLCLAVTAPWHVAQADLAMLGSSQARAVVTVDGWQLGWAWIAGIAGLVAAVHGVALAVDRHPGWTRPVTGGAGVAALVCGLVGFAVRPPLDSFPDAAGALAELRDVAGALPTGVELTLSVRAGIGPVVAIVGAVAVLVGVATARELDTR